MIDWQPMSLHPLDSTPVLVCFRCPLTGQFETQPGWYDDGCDSEGEPYEEPGWYWFDADGTGPCEPLTWAMYPIPDAAAWAKVGSPQVSA